MTPKAEPKPFTFLHKGLCYKFGAHGFLYVLQKDEWYRSTKSPDIIVMGLLRNIAALKRQLKQQGERRLKKAKTEESRDEMEAQENHVLDQQELDHDSQARL